MFVECLLVALLSAALKGDPITVQKCCDLDANLKWPNKTTYRCKSGLDAVPLIYSPLQKKFVTHLPTSWHIVTAQPRCDAPVLLEAHGLSRPFFLFTNGNLLLLETNAQIPPARYCYASNTSVLYCDQDGGPPPDKMAVAKVKKCCGRGAIYSELKQSCVALDVPDYRIVVPDGLTVSEGFAPCDSRLLIAGKLHEGRLRVDGAVELDSLRIVLKPETFCLEHVLENAGKSASIFTCASHLPSTTPASATPTSSGGVGVPVDDVRLRFYPVGLLLSAVFLTATLAAGAVLPASHHHALHWRCQTNHVACLLVGDVLLAITQLAGAGISGGFCVAIAIAMHFLFLAAFFWLNTMCFNIWWTFRDLRPGTLEKRQERRRLRLYGVYAWGCPFVLSAAATALDAVPRGAGYDFLRPRFGEVTCWFPGDMEILTYFFGPVGILLLINLFLFGATARELTCGLWKRELVKSTTERAALGRVCMKLVVVMGVTWIADVMSWAIGGPQALWYVTDFINALQGVFIFVVVACQPQVWTAIKRLWCKRQSLAADVTGNGNQHSSSSHGLPSYGESVTNHSVSNTTRSVPLETSC